MSRRSIDFGAIAGLEPAIRPPLHRSALAQGYRIWHGALPLPAGERVGVRGFGHTRVCNPSPQPSPYGRGSPAACVANAHMRSPCPLAGEPKPALLRVLRIGCVLAAALALAACGRCGDFL